MHTLSRKLIRCDFCNAPIRYKDAITLRDRVYCSAVHCAHHFGVSVAYVLRKLGEKGVYP